MTCLRADRQILNSRMLMILLMQAESCISYRDDDDDEEASGNRASATPHPTSTPAVAAQEGVDASESKGSSGDGDNIDKEVGTVRCGTYSRSWARRTPCVNPVGLSPYGFLERAYMERHSAGFLTNLGTRAISEGRSWQAVGA
eukprot:163354-Pelagomonas_calceolata.AAC.6